MANFTGQQRSVVAPNEAYPGSFTGIPVYPCTEGFLPLLDTAVGNFVWGVPGVPRQVTPIKPVSGNPVIAGWVLRNHATVIPFADTIYGYSEMVQANYQLEVVVLPANGYFKVTSLNSGGVILSGDTLYLNDTTGITEVATSSPGSGHTSTGYQVINPAVLNTFGFSMVTASKNQQF